MSPSENHLFWGQKVKVMSHACEYWQLLAVVDIVCLKFTGTTYCYQGPVKKVKAFHKRYRVLGPELIPVYRQSARRLL